MSHSSRVGGGARYEKLALLAHVCQVQIFRVQIMPSFELGHQETHNKIEYGYKGFKGLDRQVERTETLTVASCVLLLMLLFLLPSPPLLLLLLTTYLLEFIIPITDAYIRLCTWIFFRVGEAQ